MKPRAIRRYRRWCSCMASAARRGPGADNSDFSATAIAPSPGTCRAMADRRRCRPSASPPRRRLARFPAAGRRDKPVIVGHSIGGMIVQQLLAHDPRLAGAVVLAQTSPAFGKPDGDWQKAFHRCPARPARSRRNAGHAGAIAGQGIGRRRSRCRGHGAGARLHGGGSRSELSRHHAGLLGFDLRPALKNIAVPTLVLSGSRDKNAPAPMMAKMAVRVLNRTARARPFLSTDRLTTVTPARSASSWRVIPRSASSWSRCTSTACSSSGFWRLGSVGRLLHTVASISSRIGTVIAITRLMACSPKAAMMTAHDRS